MKIENQVCTLLQGKRLIELGITPFTAAFRWCHFCPDPTGEHEGYTIVCFKDGANEDEMIGGEYLADAFTASEVTQMLPFGNFCIPVFEGEITPESEVMYEVHLETWITPNRFRTVLVDAEFRKKYMDSGIDYTMAESLTSMLIKMLEQGVIEVGFCNTRLNEN